MALVLLFFNKFTFCTKSVPVYHVSLSHLYPKVVIFAEIVDCTNWSLRYQNLTLKMSGTLPPYCCESVPSARDPSARDPSARDPSGMRSKRPRAKWNERQVRTRAK